MNRERLRSAYHRLPKVLRRLLVVSAASALFGVGLLLLVLPGPGMLFIAAGLATLAVEFTWAHTYLEKVKHHTRRLDPRHRKRKKH